MVHTIPLWRRHAGFVHGYTTRALGNLSYRTASRTAATERRVQLAGELGIDPSRLFSIPLHHTNRVAVLRNESFLARLDNRGYLTADPEEIVDWPHVTPELYTEIPRDREYIDGVVFNVPEVYSLVITADCAAVAFFDPKRRVCGNAHIGLVGAINQLAVAMVAAMVEGFGSDPRDIEAVIFPSIRQCHYDTSNSRTWQRIKAGVFAAYGEQNPFYSSGYFDLPGFIRRQLIDAGVDAERICDTGLCTVCRSDTFFSHVGAGNAEAQAVEGRFGAVVGMRRL